MLKNIKDNLLVILAISLPIIFIGVLFVIAYIPSLTLKPKYNFVYYLPTTFDYYNQYSNGVGNFPYYAIDNSTSKFKLDETQAYPFLDGAGKSTPIRDPNNSTKINFYKVVFYLYNTSDNSSKEISESEFLNLKGVSIDKSPDGFTVDNTYNNSSGPLFGLFGLGYNGQDIYLRSGSYNKKVNINYPTSFGSSTYGTFHFVGWVE